jgi:hypothetical protein
LELETNVKTDITQLRLEQDLLLNQVMPCWTVKKCQKSEMSAFEVVI